MLLTSQKKKKKLTIALIHKLPEEKLKEVFKILHEAKNVADAHQVGFHNLKSSIVNLMRHTADPKYDFIRNKEYKEVK